MLGRMMKEPLLVSHLLDRAAKFHPTRTVTTRTAGGRQRHTYAEIVGRCARLAHVLDRLGVAPGERVATYAWNTHRHLELYLAVPSSGRVLHTLNIRLFPEQVTYIVNHADDAVIFVDDSLVAALEPLAESLPRVRAFVVMGDGPLPKTTLSPVYSYEELLASAPDTYAYPRLDENEAAGMCYTSGTTGNPKGVVYSHRSLMLHSLGQAAADCIGLRERDTVLTVVPMFHANSWGLPYTATMVGANQVYPGTQPTPAEICELVESERATVTAGVPTVLLGMLSAMEQRSWDLSSLRCIPCGGSAVPESLLRRFDEKGLTVLQLWGMTETSPIGTIAAPSVEMEDWSPEQQRAVRTRQGRPVPWVDIRLVDDAGREVPWDGKSMGELQVRGPWVVGEYYEDDRSPASFDDGWFRTGDIATVDPRGYMQIADRAKDVIKSGGEWISSVELENALIGHPKVLEAAVIGLAHERWQERPLACIVPAPGDPPTKEELREFLSSQVARWSLPEDFIFVEAIPKTSVGKIAKRELRDRFEGYRWSSDEGDSKPR